MAVTANPTGSHPLFQTKNNSRPKGLLLFLAGVEGFEPSQTVLETGVLPLTPYPYIQLYVIFKTNKTKNIAYLVDQQFREIKIFRWNVFIPNVPAEENELQTKFDS